MKDPRIIIYDIETLPDLVAVMRHFPRLSDYPGLTFKAEINSVLCLSWKVFGQEKVNCLKLWDYDTWTDDPGHQPQRNFDKPLLEDFLEIVKDADAVITHNGKRFDEKFIQTRILIHKLSSLPPVPHIDTLPLAKKHLSAFNNRLGNLTKLLCDETKMDNSGWQLWEKIQFGCHTKKDLKEMSDYCKQDSVSTEALFKILRPFAKNIPNHNLYSTGNGKVCPSCGSTRIISNGYRSTKTSSYKRYSCIDCGSWSRTDIKDFNARSI